MDSLSVTLSSHTCDLVSTGQGGVRGPPGFVSFAAWISDPVFLPNPGKRKDQKWDRVMSNGVWGIRCFCINILSYIKNLILKVHKGHVWNTLLHFCLPIEQEAFAHAKTKEEAASEAAKICCRRCLLGRACAQFLCAGGLNSLAIQNLSRQL